MKGFLLGYCNLDLESFSRSSANLVLKVFTTSGKSSNTFSATTTHLTKMGAKENKDIGSLHN